MITCSIVYETKSLNMCLIFEKQANNILYYTNKTRTSGKYSHFPYKQFLKTEANPLDFALALA